jgi:hypothetical protein
MGLTRGVIAAAILLAAGGEPAPAAMWEGQAELRLADGRLVRLAGVLVPPGTPLDPPGAVARLEPDPPLQDRHGRLRAQLFAPDWVQGELVRAGRAVVDPAPDVPAAVLGELLGLERAARAARLGVWVDGALGPFPAGRVEAPPGGYVLVQGRVQAVARARSFVYLNFGRDWRRDFTIRAEIAHARRLARQGLDLERLAGRELLVRGWLLEANGPLIELMHPAQIEVVE